MNELRPLIALNDHSVSVCEQHLHLLSCGWMFTCLVWLQSRPNYCPHSHTNKPISCLSAPLWSGYTMRCPPMAMRAGQVAIFYRLLSWTTRASFGPILIINRDASVWTLITLRRKPFGISGVITRYWFVFFMPSCSTTCLHISSTFNHTDIGRGWRCRSWTVFFPYLAANKFSFEGWHG